MHTPIARALGGAAVCFALALGVRDAHATSITIDPSSQDTYVREDAVNTIPGGGNSWRIKLHSRTARRWRGLVQFDLSSIPQFSTITSATVRLRETGAALDASKVHGLYKITAGWLQSSTKWSNQPAHAVSATTTATVGIGNATISFTPVTVDVQAWINTPTSNHGWMIIDSAEGDSDDDYVKYVARESRNNTTRKPKLDVDFTAPPCSVNADCTDANPCTINERCSAGHCAVDPKNCDDANACTDDICDPGQPEGSQCLHPLGVCNDGFDCTIDTCDPDTGCTNTPVDSSCTAGGCQVATCVADPDDTTLDEAGCKVTSVQPTGTTCATDGIECTTDQCSSACQNGTNDGAICTVSSQCPGGTCESQCTHPNKTLGTPCSADGNPCTDDVCDGAGSCHVNNTAPCSDGLFCNGADTCSGGACTSHQGDPCTGNPQCNSVCNEAMDNCAVSAGTPCAADGNPCTDDVCNGSGSCGVNNSAPCSDGLFCDGSDTCSGGGCTAHQGDPCSGNPQCNNFCNEAMDNCAVSAGTPCAADGNPCTDDVCNGSGTCGVNNTAPCSDGLFCNGPDTCAGGSCSSHLGDPCTGGPECNNVCNEGAGNCLVSSGTTCSTDDGNPCTDTKCNGSGVCGLNNSDPCNDSIFCNGSDTCAGGSCSSHLGDPCTSGPECNNVCNESGQNCLVPATTPCTSDGNVCTDDVCDGSGLCGVNNTDPCDDSNTCTINDQCAGGVCQGNSMTCGDGTVQGSCGEQCDDAGQNGNGTCTANCKLVCGPIPQAGCRKPLVAHKAKLVLKNKTPDKKDSLNWKWVKGAATLIGDFGTPLTSTGYAICVYDASGNSQPRLFAFAPPGGTCSGKPCWKLSTTNIKYKDNKALDPDGVSTIVLKSGAASSAKALVKGKGANLGMPSLPLTTPVIVQLKKNDDPSICWDANFSTPEKNLSDQFKSTAD